MNNSVPKYKLALLQMCVEGGNPQKNLAEAGKLIAQAAESGANVVLLPEMMDLGWTHPSVLTQAQSISDGETSRLLSRLARQYGLYICAGLSEIESGIIYNAAVLIDPAGEIILKHRKINELDIGRPFYSPGDRLNVCRTPLGTFGLMICADAAAGGQVLSRSLALMGADIILSPCAWAVPASHDNEAEPYGQEWLSAYQPVARDFSVWIAGCSYVGRLDAGPWQGWNAIGCSLVVDPRGEVAIKGSYGETASEILYVDIRKEIK